MNAPPPYPAARPSARRVRRQQGCGYSPPAPGGPPGPPPKKGANGCLIALGVAGAFILLGGLVAALFVYRFVHSPDGQKLVSAVTSGTALVDEARNAPGMNEVRGLGCTQAMMLDRAKVQAIADSLGDAAMS